MRDDIARAMSADVPWDRVLNSICTRPHPVAVEAAALAADTNLGDPRIFGGTSGLQDRVVGLLLDFLGAPDGSGALVSGGTEANLVALLVARERARAAGTLTDSPQVVVGSTVHFSFHKIFSLLGMTPVVVEVDDTLRLPVSRIGAHLNPDTVAVVATAGSSEFGVVDLVDEIGPLVQSSGVRLHVDAATGGFIIPFARRLGHDLPQFDFSVPGVASITIDPHKYGLAPVPSGAILFADPEDAGRFSVRSFFIDTPVHRTFLGTRPGSAAAATYAVLEHLGWDGFTELTKRNYEVTDYCVSRLRQAGYEIFLRPELNIVTARVPRAAAVSALLEEWGWIVSTSRRYPEVLRLVITGHVTREVIDAFVPALLKASARLASTEEHAHTAPDTAVGADATAGAGATGGSAMGRGRP